VSREVVARLFLLDDDGGAPNNNQQHQQYGYWLALSWRLAAFSYYSLLSAVVLAVWLLLKPFLLLD
jgi:hypothetical protein